MIESTKTDCNQAAYSFNEQRKWTPQFQSVENFRDFSSSIRWTVLSQALFFVKAATAFGILKAAVNRAKISFLGGSALLIGLHFVSSYWHDFCDKKLFADTYNRLFLWQKSHLDLRSDLSGKSLINQINVSKNLLGKEPLKEAQAIYLQKALAHACSIDGNVKLRGSYFDGLSLESGFAEEWAAEFARALVQIESEFNLSPEEIGPIQRAVCRLFASKSLTIEEYEKGEVVFLHTGFHGHCVFTLIFKGYLLVCNRGDGGRKSVEVYKLESELTGKFVEKILDTESKEEYQAALAPSSFLCGVDEIPSGLYRDDATRELEKRCQLPGQTSNNCSWSNFEAAIYGYFCLTQPERVKEIFDKFCLNARVNLFDDLLKDGSELNLELAVQAANLIGPSARSALRQFCQERQVSSLDYFKAIVTTGSFKLIFNF